MVFKTHESKVGLRNRMLFLILVQINTLHDAVFMFNENEKLEELNRLKRYLNNKINIS